MIAIRLLLWALETDQSLLYFLQLVHAHAHARTHTHTHLVSYVVHSDEVASDRLLLSDESVQVRLVVSGASGAVAVGVNRPKVVSTCSVLQVHLPPRDKSRAKSLQGRQQGEVRAITEMHWSLMEK